MNLGKFAKLKVGEFLGKPYFTTLELEPSSKQLLVNYSLSFEHTIEDEAQIEDSNDNRNILDDSSSQKLTLQEIESMKKEMSGKEIVENLVENSATFDQKTEFAKSKYLRRKKQKFLKLLFVQPVSAMDLCTYFFHKDRKKIM